MFKIIGIIVAILVIGIGAILVYRNNQKQVESDLNKVKDVADTIKKV